MRKIILLIIIINFFSCKRNGEEIIYYDKNGNIESKNYVSDGKNLDSVIYFSNGKVDTKVFFPKKDKTECYVKYYGKKGLSSEGKTKGEKKNGKWKYYDLKGKLRKIVEFKVICNEEYPNQEWNYDSNGKLNEIFCNYFTCKIGETIEINGEKGKNLKIYYSPMFKKDAICTINLSRKINKDFCNVDSIEKIDFKCDSTFTFNLPIKLKDFKEIFYLKGYIEEHHFDEDSNDKSSLKHTSRRVYIDVPIK